MSYRVPPLTYRRTPSSHKDRKGSFTTRPTGKVPGYKNVIKKGLLFTATSMLAQYQQGGRGLFRWWGKPESLEKNHRKFLVLHFGKISRKSRLQMHENLHKCFHSHFYSNFHEFLRGAIKATYMLQLYTANFLFGF